MQILTMMKTLVIFKHVPIPHTCNDYDVTNNISNSKIGILIHSPIIVFLPPLIVPVIK